ncbi:MAG: glycine cleavage system aminomethyltransferase GcvT [Victivallaceae bacterium]|nr:glycine cleavage system aminomethyltransferase GcvT [Victivallaceae bacterium]
MGAYLETPLCKTHVELGAKMVPFAGWNMPVQYPGGILAEHQHTRTQCSLFDICHMGEFQINGAAAAESLDRALARKVSDLAIGSCRYNLLLNDQGGIMDDLIVYRMAGDDFMLVVNAGTIATDAAAIKERLSDGVGFRDMSKDMAKLDLQGPRAAEVLAEFDIAAETLPAYYHWTFADLGGLKCILSRTGYTGELGFELYFSAAYAVDLWNELLDISPVRPAGLGARDTLRLEMGYALYGHELKAEWTPADCGLAALARTDTYRDFVGRKALAAATPTRRRVAVRLSGRRAARAGDRVLDASGNPVGVVTSGTFCPTLGVACALCSVEADAVLPPDGSIVLANDRANLDGTVVETPFVKETSLRMPL